MGNQELSDTNVCQMNLSIETDAVSIKGYFNNLENLPRFAQYVPQDRNPESMGREWAENRKLMQFFQWQQINPIVTLCIILSKNIHLVLVHEDVSLQYFISAS